MIGVSLLERLDATGQAIRDQQQAASRLALTLAELAEETDFMVAEIRASGLAMPVLKEGPSPVLKEKPSHMDVDLHHDHQPGRDNSGWGIPFPETPKTPQTPGNGHEQRIKGLADASERVKTPRMFADPAELVAKTRDNLTEEVSDATKLYKQTGIFQAMAKNYWFEMSSVVLVIFSCIWMAVEIDFNDKTSLHESDTIFQVVAHLTCLLFLLEIVVRILAFRHLRDAMKDAWVVFDLVLVLFFVVETWIIGTIAVVTDMTMSGGGMKLVIMLRVLRLMRIMRLAHVLRVAPELMVIVRGIGRALRAILVVLVLILIIIFVAAILFTVLMEGSTLGQEYFPNVPTSMGTLMLDFTLSGSRGTALTRAAWAVHPILALLLVLFVCVANITMLGVLTALLVQTVKLVAEVEKEEKTLEHVVGTMEYLWEAFDCDGDGTVDQNEFDSMISFQDTARVLRTLDIDAEGLACISDFVFAENRGRLNRSAFLRMVLDSRSTKKATLKDHIETRKFVEARLVHLFQRGWAHGSRKARFLGQGEITR